MKYYAKVENGKIVKKNLIRSDFGVGEKSDDSVCVKLGYYPIVYNPPAFDRATQIIELKDLVVDTENHVVNAVYVVKDIPQSELLEKAKSEAEAAISKHIQERIDTYNRDHDILLASIDSCAKYALVTSYAHHQFCIDVINWAASVWEYARQVQADVLAGNRTMPTENQLISELPVYNGVV